MCYRALDSEQGARDGHMSQVLCLPSRLLMGWWGRDKLNIKYCLTGAVGIATIYYVLRTVPRVLGAFAHFFFTTTLWGRCMQSPFHRWGHGNTESLSDTRSKYFEPGLIYSDWQAYYPTHLIIVLCLFCVIIEEAQKSGGSWCSQVTCKGV